ncbi:MAG: DUF945 family protein [Sulfurovum sp.]|nr:DUF945 family protein [Sulfurovum sp.]
MIKKFGIASMGLLVLAVGYFLTLGSTQLMAEIKTQLQQEITLLNSQGFGIQSKEISDKEHQYIVSIDAPQKISTFLKSKGIELSIEDIALFQGMTWGIDTQYIPNPSTSLVLDIYPLTLPSSILLASVSPKDKKVLAQIETMLKKKTFLIHIEINSLLDGFIGHLKDIKEVLHVGEDINFTIEGLTFTGKLSDNKLSKVTQNVQKLLFHTVGQLEMKLENFTSEYTFLGQSYATHYTLENLQFHSDKDINISVEHLTLDSDATLENNLSSFSFKTQIGSLDYIAPKYNTSLHNFYANFKAENFDTNALVQLENINPNNEKEVLAILQKLISKGVHLEIPSLGVKEIIFNQQTLKGFDFNSSFTIDKSLDLASLQKNPMAVITAMNAYLNLSLSSDIFTLLVQQPQATMALMLFKPKDVKGKKVYEIKLRDAKLLVNGVPMM